MADPKAQELNNKNPCGLCRAMGNPTCGGHSPTGGKKEGGVTDGKKSLSGHSETPSKSTSNSNVSEKNISWAKEMSDNKTSLNISYKAGMLDIQNNKGSGILKFESSSQEDKQAVSEFFKAVKAALDSFKDENGIAIASTNESDKGNVLTITIPNPKHYDAFIKHLEKANLLPVPSAEQKKEMDKKDLQSNANKDKTPNPFSTRLERK